MLFNIIMPSCHTILVGCRHFGIGSDLSAIASARELHPVKPYNPTRYDTKCRGNDHTVVESHQQARSE